MRMACIESAVVFIAVTGWRRAISAYAQIGIEVIGYASFESVEIDINEKTSRGWS